MHVIFRVDLREQDASGIFNAGTVQIDQNLRHEPLVAPGLLRRKLVREQTIHVEVGESRQRGVVLRSSLNLLIEARINRDALPQVVVCFLPR